MPEKPGKKPGEEESMIKPEKKETDPELNHKIGLELQKIISNKTITHNFESDNERSTVQRNASGIEYQSTYTEVYKGKNIDLSIYDIDGCIIELEKIDKKTNQAQTELFFMKYLDEGESQENVEINYLQSRVEGEVVPNSILRMEGLINLIRFEITNSAGKSDLQELANRLKKPRK